MVNILYIRIGLYKLVDYIETKMMDIAAGDGYFYCANAHGHSVAIVQECLTAMGI
jgi:hypothetical protein